MNQSSDPFTYCHDDLIISPVVYFIKNCKGVALVKRGTDDKHVCFQIITEDDGQWFSSKQTTSSSFWMGELIECLKEADAWLDTNAKKTKWGWEFKR